MSHPEQKTNNATFPQEQGLAEALINTTQDAVITIDRQGHIEIFNAAAERIFGYTRAESLATNELANDAPSDVFAQSLHSGRTDKSSPSNSQ